MQDIELKALQEKLVQEHSVNKEYSLRSTSFVCSLVLSTCKNLIFTWIRGKRKALLALNGSNVSPFPGSGAFIQAAQSPRVTIWARLCAGPTGYLPSGPWSVPPSASSAPEHPCCHSGPAAEPWPRGAPHPWRSGHSIASSHSYHNLQGIQTEASVLQAGTRGMQGHWGCTA